MTAEHMTWEQMLEALNLLAPTIVMMREPGDWYVQATGRWIANHPTGGLATGLYGEGCDPATAVISDWRKMTSISVPRFIRTSKGNFIWRGYMWVPLDEPEDSRLQRGTLR
jgi:hypothetical protein